MKIARLEYIADSIRRARRQWAYPMFDVEREKYDADLQFFLDALEALNLNYLEGPVPFIRAINAARKKRTDRRQANPNVDLS